MKKFSGVVPPMVTPFTMSGELDEPSVRKIIENMISGGVNGIFVLGTNGELSSMSMKMRHQMVKLTVEQMAHRLPVYAGITDNCLANTLMAATEYARLGVDALVAHLPSYYPLGEAEIREWFLRLADNSPLPLFLYNIPVTTHHSIPLPVVQELLQHPRVAGIKDSEGDVTRQTAELKILQTDPVRSFFCGASALAMTTLTQGADGLVPATANFAPAVYTQLCHTVNSGDHAAAEACQHRQDRLTELYLKRGRPLAQNIAALKGLMWATGLCGSTVLAPLRTLDEAQLQMLKTDYQKTLSELEGINHE